MSAKNNKTHFFINYEPKDWGKIYNVIKTLTKLWTNVKHNTSIHGTKVYNGLWQTTFKNGVQLGQIDEVATVRKETRLVKSTGTLLPLVFVCKYFVVHFDHKLYFLCAFHNKKQISMCVFYLCWLGAVVEILLINYLSSLFILQVTYPTLAHVLIFV